MLLARTGAKSVAGISLAGAGPRSGAFGAGGASTTGAGGGCRTGAGGGGGGAGALAGAAGAGPGRPLPAKSSGISSPRVADFRGAAPLECFRNAGAMTRSGSKSSIESDASVGVGGGGFIQARIWPQLNATLPRANPTPTCPEGSETVAPLSTEASLLIGSGQPEMRSFSGSTNGGWPSSTGGSGSTRAAADAGGMAAGGGTKGVGGTATRGFAAKG